jgi:hypothetical protein
MNDVRLKTVEKNQVLALIEAVGLNPLEFEWLVEDSEEYIDGEPVIFRASYLVASSHGLFLKVRWVHYEVFARVG